MDFSVIRKCEFILLDEEDEILVKEFAPQDDCFLVRIESHESDIEANTYIYKVKYTFIDGSVATPNRGMFTIMD